MKAMLILLTVLFISPVQAKDSEGEKLIQGCSELLGMYKNKKEKRLMAGLLASSSDALLAGYCLGMVKAYRQFSNNACYADSWFDMAETIASEWTLKDKRYSVNALLNSACRG